MLEVNFVLKKFSMLIFSVFLLFFLLNLPGLIPIGSSNLREIQRDVFGWNYIGLSANYVLFIIIFKFRKKPLAYYGVHTGKWKKNIVWYSILTISILTLFRLIDLLSYGGLKFQLPTLSTFIFQFFYVAFGEELFYRGYVQTDYGIWTASILFGALHSLNIFADDISWTTALSWGLFATFLGFIMGFIRKKTDSIYATSLFHGLVNILNYFFVPF